MQKKIIALAVAGLVSGAAFAQANVTVSGRMAIGIDGVSAGGCSGAACANLTSRFRAVDNQSNIRFAGEEALGNGTSAWFQIESALGTTDNVGTSGAQTSGAATSTGIGTRNTAVGLKGNWGSFLVGKWDIYYSDLAVVDSTGLVGGQALLSNSLDILFTQNGANAGGGRFNNTMMYTTPDWSGLKAKIGYSTTTANEVLTPGAGKETNWYFAPSYVNGPIVVFYSYLGRKDIGNVASGATARFNRLGGAYTFPMGIKVGLIWDTNAVTPAGAGESKRTAWALPLSWVMGPHTFAFTYAKAGDTGNVSSTGAKMTMLGYSYAMSKRTSMGVSWTGISNDTGGKYDFWHPSSNLAAQSAVGVPAGADPRALSLNMTHLF